MNFVMVENRDVIIMYSCILVLVDFCYDGIRELFGEKIVIVLNISSFICNYIKCICMYIYIYL